MIEIPSDVGVFALVCDPTGTWFAIAPAVRELSGRHGIRRVKAAPDPNGDAGEDQIHHLVAVGIR